jgi:hypothetical protein
MTLPFLQSYSMQTTADLIALEGTYRIDSLVLAFEQAIERKASPSAEESVVLAIEAFEREVNNGGFSQFFTNSSGAFAATIEASLRAIDCPNTADIARDAIAALSTDGTLTAEAVGEAAQDDKVRDALNGCDSRFFSSGEPIADRLFAWIKANQPRIVVGAT